MSGVRSFLSAVRAQLSKQVLIFILVGLILGACAGAFAAFGRPTPAQASAAILVNPLDGNPFSTTGRGDDLINLESEARLLTSDPVAGRVKAATGSDLSIQDLLANVSAKVPVNTQIINISVSSFDAAEATALADSFSEEYLAFREERSSTLLDAQLERINDQISQRQTDQARLANRLSAQPENSSNASVLQARLDAVSSQISQLRSRSAELNSTSSNPGQVITPATLEPTSTLSSPLLLIPAGALAGVAMALGILVARNRLDPSVRGLDDLEALGIESVGLVRPVPTHRGSTLDVHDLSELALMLLSHKKSSEGLVLLVGPAEHSAQNLDVARGLFDALVAAQRPTLLADTTGHHRVTPEETTLSAVLRSPAPADLPSGPGQFGLILGTVEDERLSDVLLRPSLAKSMTRWRRDLDVVIVAVDDFDGAIARSLAPYADMALIEAHVGRSERRRLMDITELYSSPCAVVLIDDSSTPRTQVASDGASAVKTGSQTEVAGSL